MEVAIVEAVLVIEVWTDTAKLTDIVIARFGDIWSEKVRCSSNMKMTLIELQGALPITRLLNCDFSYESVAVDKILIDIMRRAVPVL